MSKKVRNILIAVVAVLVLGSCIFMFAISPISVKKGNREMPDADSQTGEILSGIVVRQDFNNITDNINEIAIVFSRDYYLEENTNIIIELLNDSEVLIHSELNADDIEGNHRTYLKPASPISGLVGKDLTLKISTDSTAGTGLSIMCNNSDNSSKYTYGDNVVNGTLCFSITGE